MSTSRSAVLSLLLTSLATVTPAFAQSAPEDWDTSGARHLELTAENAREEHPAGISPHHPTTLVFNAPLRPGGVTVEDEQRVKVALNEAEGLVTLLPSDTVPSDKPLTVTVRFADGAVPESVTFRLVVHPTRAEHQVRVYRRPRSAESYRQGERQERERAERCEAALEAEHARPEGQNPRGLAGLFDAGLVGKGSGIAVRALASGKELTQRSGETLEVMMAHGYHAEIQKQVAVELTVRNTGNQPWTAEGVEGATLVSTDGARLRVVRVIQPEPFTPGAHHWLVVVAEATVEQAKGTFLLKLGETGGPRTLTVRGITFP
ncbi:MAG TPA: DUF2381 family protein [Archangium sp.]|jgi:uncharacterized protein (TIGR02268 family)|uniref:DUF2381 family protein n=1 Tax=Archangium sp. TaxID=1872627 RepID=UPI002ED907D5